MGSNSAAEFDELQAMVRGIRERVRARFPSGHTGSVQLSLADLMPLLHARDAAEGKVAAIGTVNPRPGGVVNSLIQIWKKTIARVLDWHVREQVEFNRAAVAYMQAGIDALNEQNRAFTQLVSLLEQIELKIEAVRREIPDHLAPHIERMGRIEEEARQCRDMRTHWSQWREEWVSRQNASEIHQLRTISELTAAYQHRVSVVQAQFQEAMRSQHAGFTDNLTRTALEMEQRYWRDMREIKLEFERLIQNELRVIRQRGLAQPPAVTSAAAPEAAAGDIDWLHFADRFRGSVDDIRGRQQRYVDRFRGCGEILDLGCGRGEFLEAMRDTGLKARGLDLSEESVALCRARGLDAEKGDIFTCLAALPPSSVDGIYCSQVVEHLPPGRLPELVKLAARALAKGGLIAIETPNPECLAIFATHFYIDPTHTRPVPPALLAFYLEEAGCGQIEVERLNPAIETMPSVGELPESFRQMFFGGLDYAIFARKLS